MGNKERRKGEGVRVMRKRKQVDKKKGKGWERRKRGIRRGERKGGGDMETVKYNAEEEEDI